MKEEVHAIIFKKSAFDMKTALQWMRIHKYNPKNVHITDNCIRFTLNEPTKYTHYIAKGVDNNTIKIITGFF